MKRDLIVSALCLSLLLTMGVTSLRAKSMFPGFVFPDDVPCVESTPSSIGAVSEDVVALKCRDMADNQVAALLRLTKLKWLDVSACPRLSDQGIKRLAVLPLEGLNATGVQLRAPGIRALSKMPSLKVLAVSGAVNWEADDVSPLAQSVSIESLYLSWEDFSDAHLALLCKASAIRTFGLWTARSMSRDACLLAHQWGLECLDLTGCTALPTASLAVLAAIPTLRRLCLDQCTGVDNSVVLAMCKNEQLQSVSLRDAGTLTDAAMVGLGRLKALRELDLSRWSIGNDAITQDGLRTLAFCVDMRVLRLHGRTAVAAELLSTLAGWKLLVEIDLGFCANVDDTALTYLSRVKSLRRVSLAGLPGVSDIGIMKLAEALPLQAVDLSLCTRITDRSLHALARCSLTELGLHGCTGCTPQGAMAVLGCETLVSVTLSDTNCVNDEVTRALVKLKRLETLSVANTLITDGGVASFSGVPKLRVLILSGCTKITDYAIKSLTGIESLRHLQITNCTGISKAAMSEVRRLMPLCHVEG